VDTTLVKYRGERQGARSDEPSVSIQKGGIFSLNYKAFSLLGKPSEVVFLYDKDCKVVGIQAAQAGEDYSHRVRRQQKSRGKLISAKGFLDFVGLDYQSERIRVKPVFRNNVLRLDLQDSKWRTEKDDSEAVPLLRVDQNVEIIEETP